MIACAILTTAACSPEEVAGTTTTTTTVASTTTTTTLVIPETGPMEVRSPSFSDGDPIPKRHTCDGGDINPALMITNIPDETSHLAVIVEDHDAPLGTWFHWIEFDIPPEGDSFQIKQNHTDLGVSGLNSWNLTGYGGPCPPAGETHEYVFRVVALSEPLDLPESTEADIVLEELDERIVAEATLTGIYGR